MLKRGEIKIMNRFGVVIVPKNEITRKFIEKCQQPYVPQPRTYVMNNLFFRRESNGATTFLGTPQDVITQIISRRP